MKANFIDGSLALAQGLSANSRTPESDCATYPQRTVWWAIPLKRLDLMDPGSGQQADV